MKEGIERGFASAPTREPVHAGSGYPGDRHELTGTLRQYLGDATSTHGRVRAIAAPHVSPYGGVESYRAAYSALTPADADRTFVILGTSHYGEPDRFGLTRKPFVTPFGKVKAIVTLPVNPFCGAMVTGTCCVWPPSNTLNGSDQLS